MTEDILGDLREETEDPSERDSPDNEGSHGASWLAADPPSRWRDVPWRERWIGLVITLAISGGSVAAVRLLHGNARGYAVIAAVVLVPLGVHLGRVIALRLARKRHAVESRRRRPHTPPRRSPVS